MTLSVEFDTLIKRFAKESTSAIEQALMGYRAICQSDEEFSKRASEVRTIDQPTNIRQFYFDGQPAFYAKIDFRQFEISQTIHFGFWNVDHHI